mgnify:CR=1 FL=1
MKTIDQNIEELKSLCSLMAYAMTKHQEAVRDGKKLKGVMNALLLLPLMGAITVVSISVAIVIGALAGAYRSIKGVLNA